jgi:hypothetical protein
MAAVLFRRSKYYVGLPWLRSIELHNLSLRQDLLVASTHPEKTLLTATQDKSSVTAGVLNETLVSSTSSKVFWTNDDDINFSKPLLTLDTNCITPEEHSALMKQGYHIDPNERWLPYNLNFTWPQNGEFNHTFPESMGARQCFYGISYMYLITIEAYIADLFTGILNPPNVWLSAGFGSFKGPLALQMMYNFGNVDFDRVERTFANISESMTSYIRLNSPSGYSSPAVGDVTETKTCIAIRWGWIALPAGLVLATLAFFVLMIIETKPSLLRPDLWKSSPCGLLYHSLADVNGKPPVLRDDNGVQGLEFMEAFVETAVVRLQNPAASMAKLEIKAS